MSQREFSPRTKRKCKANALLASIFERVTDMARLTQEQVERFDQMVAALENTFAALQGMAQRVEAGAAALEGATETLVRLESLCATVIECASDAREVERRAFRIGYEEGWYRRGRLQRQEAAKWVRN